MAEQDQGLTTAAQEWDGVAERDAPPPRWWVWLFYWVVYPAWPTATAFTRGVLGYSSRGQLAVELAELGKLRAEKAKQNAR
jgi:cytochrome c oxidase cbb3-type subunit 3